MGRVLHNVIAIFFALASAIVVAWGTVIRHRIALEASGAVMRTAMGNPLWWIGTGAAVLAYALQLVALAFGTLLVVQPVLVLSLMFTLPLSAWYSKRRMPGHEIFWCVALTLAVGILVLYGRPQASEENPTWSDWWPALLVGAVLLIGLAIAGVQWHKYRALAFGTACGVIYGYVALLAKGATTELTHGGIGSLLTSWHLYALIALAGTGTVVQQYSFHAGPLTHSLPAMTIAEPILAFGMSYWVLGEKFSVSSAAGWAVMATALAVMILATIVLARVPVGPRPAQSSVK